MIVKTRRLLKQGKYDECVDLLQQGALSLVKHSQMGSAVDLVKRMIVCHDAAGHEADEKNVGAFLFRWC
jgi:hypothetical protein